MPMTQTNHEANRQSSQSSQTGRADTFDQVWSTLSAADKQVLLGHTNPVLTPQDKVRLAKTARSLGAALRRGKPTSFRRTPGRGR